MKKLLLVTLLALGATQAMAGSYLPYRGYNGPVVPQGGQIQPFKPVITQAPPAATIRQTISGVTASLQQIQAQITSTQMQINNLSRSTSGISLNTRRTALQKQLQILLAKETQLNNQLNGLYRQLKSGNLPVIN